MDEEEIELPTKTFKLECSNYPEIFDQDKATCKQHFRQFGKVQRMIFKQKQHVIVVEYTNQDNYLDALVNAGEYNGIPFNVTPFMPNVHPASSQSQVTKRKPREKIVNRHKLTYLSPEIHKAAYVDNDEVNRELAAMGAYSEPIDLTQDSPVPQYKRPPKLNRVWKRVDLDQPQKIGTEKIKTTKPAEKKLMQSGARKKLKEKSKILSGEQLELLKIMQSQAFTVDEKYKVLDARDKLIRFNVKKSKLKSSPTVGTCPDMCPEKERLLREIQHQVSLYEQQDAGRHLMDASKAVKQYSRSSADQEAPLPHELRPVSVLQMTMNYLMHNIMDQCDNESEGNLGEWFHFLWDRTRGIRKDITQQALCCQGSVELVEQCARFHIHCSARLMGEDPSVFDQKINTENLTKCLQTLKYMYHDLALKGEICPNEPEFRAYVILLNLSDGNFMWEVQELGVNIQKSREVKFALEIHSAFEKRNHVKFFKLIKSTTYLNACILMRYFIQVRVQAIETLIKCFTPPKSISFYPIQELADLLFFDDTETAADFMKTYGIGMNKDNTQFLIDRSSFNMPEFPYILERSSCVENKRIGSVGQVVSGKVLSPEIYMQIQQHEVYNSFSKDGYLINDEIFNEIDLEMEERLLEDPDSRESTPERTNIVANIFASKSQPTHPAKTISSTNIFAQPKERQMETETPNVFIQNKPETALFNQKKNEVPNIFAHPKPEASSIFAQNRPEIKDNKNIFAIPPKQKATNIFSDEVDAASNPKENIFAPRNVQSSTMFGKPLSKPEAEQNIFASKSITQSDTPHQNIFAVPASNSETKQGGFHFVLNRGQKTNEVPNIFAPQFRALPAVDTQETKQQEEKELRILENERTRLQEEIRIEIEREEEERREQERKEETRRRNEEAAEKRRLEAERQKREELERKEREEQERIKREKRLEQERIERERKLEEERRRKVEELKRQQEELERQRKELEEKKKELEIKRTVKSVVSEMVEAVDDKLREETLNRIRGNIKRRFLVSYCRRWRNNVMKRKKKRKALDCSPMWAQTKDVGECARELHSKTQDLTLSYMKRYKYGKPIELPFVSEQTVGHINLFHLTYSSLRRRLCELKEKWRQHIFWKVVVSIPDIDEMVTGLHKMETILKSYIDWELNTKYGSTVYVEHQKTVTYCVEKQQGLEVKSSDANAYIFIAKSFNNLMQRRVFENLKGVGVYVKLPVVLILEDTSNSEEYLESLKDTGVVSDYAIYSCNISSHVLPSIIDNGLIFLAKNVEKYPPLEMDTLYSVLLRHLCTEIWKKASCYAKWNHEYNFCMRDPNIVINLYNEGLKLLSQIITNQRCKEYAVFPEIFKENLSSKTPNFLPCDYRYFPAFWSTPKYENHIKSILKNLELPKFLEKWPPQSETDLLLSVSKYCTEVFKNPKEPLITILNILKEEVQNESFDKITWIDAMHVMAKEKLKEQDFNLPRKHFFDENFETCIVVYDTEMLNDYISSEWFYRNNPIIEGYKKVVKDKVEEEVEKSFTKKSPNNRKRTLDISMENEDIINIINKAENVLRSPKNLRLERQNQIEELNRSLKDLEDSIRVVKKMDEINMLKRMVES